MREKLAAVLIIPSSWGSQLDGERPSTPCRIKYYPPAKIIALRSDIMKFRQFDNEHVAQVWEK
jgi:hypothetical protein